MPNRYRILVLALALSYGSGREMRDHSKFLEINMAEPAVRRGHAVLPADDDFEWKGSDPWHLMDQFINQFQNIFPTGNRNAASHKWAGFLFNHSSSLPISSFDAIQHSYCAVSGSPVMPTDGEDSTEESNAYRVTLKTVDGARVTGLVRHCCWPCLCDLQDLVRVDTQDVVSADGTHSRRFLVINDPCVGQGSCLTTPVAESQGGQEMTLGDAAPELSCSGSTLNEAVRSKSGKVIIGAFIEDDGRAANAAEEFDPHCAARAREGYQSGMGMIFRLAAQCSPFDL